MNDELGMEERLKYHRATGGQYMRRRIKGHPGVMPICPKCYDNLMTAIKPLEPRPSRLS
jgi:hypothetical protein